MKRYGWMVVLLLAGGCGSRHHGPTVHERRAAIRADHERKYGGEGFQATHWGMTRAEVRALYPEAAVTAREDLVVSTTLGERPARVFFLFAGDKLGSVFVRFATPEVLRDEHQQMVEVLTAKYGRPRKRGSSRRVLKYRESIDLAWLLTKTSPPTSTWEPARRDPVPAVNETPAEEMSSPPLVEASGRATVSPPVEAPATGGQAGSAAPARAQASGAPADDAMASSREGAREGETPMGAPPLVAVEAPRADVAGEQDAVDEAPPPLVEAQVDDDDRPDAYDDTEEEEPSSPEPEIRASRNGYVVVARWKAPETAVRLLGYQVARDRLLTLLYESDAYGEEVREEMEGRLAVELRKQARDF
ncbi:brain acid soluble protein 1 [Myxococcus sp. K38C18041901]|uniref:brain acid soluble protein 1 n=1 Tax=Myxococcus guangdongensis TaxID=2906760 RepID=UPI0020A8076B|nr:brain acid soluble protein 1 [Myxococcus guangdongensis]MCP3062809.1 brain acid soluble protein 1 [Myxococcus guangdongensis]